MEEATITNRELASLILIGLLATWALTSRGRKDLLGTFRAVLAMLLSPALLIPLLLYVGWILLSLVPASSIGLWEAQLWKPTILWLVFSGLALVFDLNDAISKEGFFRRALVRTIEVAAFIEFFAALKSFPLWIELPAQALAVLSAGVAVVARSHDQRPARRVANAYLMAFGLGAIVWSAVALVQDWSQLDRRELLLDFLLPVWLTPVALVFVYFCAAYAAHEAVWKRLAIWNKKSLWRQRLAVFVRCNLRLGALRALSGQALPDIARSSGFRSAWSEVGLARIRMRKEAEAEVAAKQRLVDNAGLKGTDENEQQLDQREFEETRKALRWLATCHMGHHRNGSGVYRSDLLHLVESHFAQDGLPAEHGIEMRVSADGQQWYASRRTITGRYFGIGAAGPPSDQWLYDGQDPPTGFPSSPEWDQFVPGEASVNWD